MKGLKTLLRSVWNGTDEPAVKLRDSPGPRGYVIRDGGGGYTFVPRLLDSKNVLETPWINSAFFACMTWITSTFPEAPLVVQKWDDESEKFVTERGSRLSRLIKRPNQFMTAYNLWAGTLISRGACGNGYWLKRRNDMGEPVELWYQPHQFVNLKYSALPGRAFIDGYEIGNTFTNYPVDVQDMVHFKHMADPTTGGRLGMSPLDGVAWEVSTDQEAAIAANTMLKHLGLLVPIFSPKTEDAEIDEAGAFTITNSYVDKTTGSQRGKPVIFSSPMDVEVIEIKPKDMDMKATRATATDRICACLGVDPLVLGLSGEQATYKNKQEAREASYESSIIPTQRIFTEQLDAQLLPDFYPNDSHNYRCWFDTTDVRILQTDMTDMSDRVSRLYMAKVVDRYEAKTMLNMVVSTEDKGVYYEQAAGGSDIKAPVAGANQTPA